MSRTREELRLPIVAEEVRFSKREIVGERVLIRRRVVTADRTIDAALRRDRIEIERRPVDQVTDVPPPIRREGDTIVIPCVDEELVITRRYRVREELCARTISETARDSRIARLRRQELEIERLGKVGTESRDELPFSRHTKEK
jgi:uncharacterized protein (TIGR02271 family)